MTPNRRLAHPLALAAYLLCLVLGAPNASWAQVATKPAAESPPATPEAEPQSVEVKGFRSAIFGATEADVRAAIAKDFAVTPNAIHASKNLAERTIVLTVRVPDVLPDGGAADVAYTLGFKSKTLIQVAVTWSKRSDDKLNPERLLQNGESLRQYFLSEHYARNSVVSNLEVKDGLLLFRGADAAGRMTVLLMQGATSGDKSAPRFTPSALTLLYIADAKAPDIYRVPAGKF